MSKKSFTQPGVFSILRQSLIRLAGYTTRCHRQFAKSEGFDPADAERIFQPFVCLHGRSAYDGSGIGLAISQKIVERHGVSQFIVTPPFPV